MLNPCSAWRLNIETIYKFGGKWADPLKGLFTKGGIIVYIGSTRIKFEIPEQYEV